MNCRLCNEKVEKILDLGSQPIANSLLSSLEEPEMIYPLEFYWCELCQFGQTNEVKGQMFGDRYPYYSSINTPYVEQCERWAKSYIEKYHPKSVLEIGCNDGYMLKNFKHINHYGFEPSKGPYKIARDLGLNISETYFHSAITLRNKYDLIIANNVIAHTPDPKDMARGIAQALSDDGIAVIEFPSVNYIIDNLYYDTIYHEHYSYFSLLSIQFLFEQFGLYMDHFQKIESHGKSFRLFFKKQFLKINRVKDIDIEGFANKVFSEKINDLETLIHLKKEHSYMALFGAAAKGNTYLNYLGIKNDLFDFCVDDTPAKQGKFLPGSRIPIVGIDYLNKIKPTLLFILPWNFKDEIVKKTKFIEEWGGVHLWKKL